MNKPEKRPEILLTNDDGVTSAGLHAAFASLKRIADVYIVAPDAERSAVGHAITTLVPIRIQPFNLGGKAVGYATTGTPADCVKIGVQALGKKPDLVVSGINLGPNTGTNVIYSGTVSAATEGRILGIPSIAVSLGALRDPDWTYAAKAARIVAQQVLKHGLPDQVLLNVNVPNVPEEKIKGWRVTRQGVSTFEEALDARKDPRGNSYYWYSGSYKMSDTDPDADALAVVDGWVSITPVSFDLTAHHSLAQLRSWSWPKNGQNPGA